MVEMKGMNIPNRLEYDATLFRCTICQVPSRPA
jgi:hypothetical protein